jgi:hypothetical protein
VQRGRGVTTYSLEASALAFLNSINRITIHHDEAEPQVQATV